MESPRRSSPTSPLRSGSTSDPASRRIHVLREDVARKIAAGEVIDRPYAVVRELLDNALDAGPRRIQVEWENGGIDLIRVSDDGGGIHPEDLPLAVLPHATSKIESEQDLESLKSLGFRGEALSSIAAVSSLQIHSALQNGDGRLLTVQHGGPVRITEQARARGTTVTVRDLFLDLPARRKFLKSGRSEALACRRSFEEKALGFPEVEFVLRADQAPTRTYPPASLLERVRAFADPSLGADLQLTESTWEWARLRCVFAPPTFSRRDRAGIQVFLNRRRIVDFGLSQAVQFAFGDFQPGGSFPYCWLFLELDPAQVDFNIHPAKREVRIRRPDALHAFVTRVLRDELRPLYHRSPELGDVWPLRKPEEGRPATGSTMAYPTTVSLPSWARETAAPPHPAPRPSLRYLGQIFRLYLVAEREGRLYVVDQHAAHERLNFDRLRTRAHERQPLLVPLEVPLDPEVREFWEANREMLERVGVRAHLDGARLVVHEIPALMRGLEPDLARFLQEPRGDTRDLEREFYARMACRMSVKANQELGPEEATRLLEEVFSLPEPRCPHGRPLWIEITEATLERLFGRT